MKAAIKFFIYMTLILLVIYSSGCSGEGQYTTANIVQTQNNEVNNQTGANDQVPVKSGLGTTASTAANDIPNESIAAAKASGVDTTSIVLYFADADGYLQAEQRSVNKTAGLARQTMQELCRGPRTQGLSATIPADTRLLDINIQEGLCTVNFSQELVDKHSGGSGSENATVYSIVNSLTQFSSIEQVQILVDGKVVDSIAGHLDVSAPLTRDSNLIRASVQLQ